MKKKIYYLGYSLIQIIISLYTFIFAKKIVKGSINNLKEMFASYEDLEEIFKNLFKPEYLIKSTKITAIIIFIIGIILLILAIKNNWEKHKGLTITLLIISIFLSGQDLLLLLGIIAVILVNNTKIKNNTKEELEKQKITKLTNIKITRKEHILGIILLLIYCFQFIAHFIIKTYLAYIIYEIFLRLSTLILVFFAFSNRFKRDFKELKNNSKEYFKYIFKWWGIMILISFIIGMIRIIIGGKPVTENQMQLYEMSLLYLIPMTIIWAPLIEETIFRGVFKRYIKNDILFIIISALLFGLLHTVFTETGIQNILIQSLQYIVIGGVLAYTYSKTNNIFVNIFIHSIQNTISIILIILTTI